MKMGSKWKVLWVSLLAIVIAGCSRSHDVTGNWQGTITPPQGKPLRMIPQVTHGDSSSLKARIYSIDQGPTGDWADLFTVQDSTVKFRSA